MTLAGEPPKFISTAGVHDEIIRESIRHQEEDDRRMEQLELFQSESVPHEEAKKQE